MADVDKLIVACNCFRYFSFTFSVIINTGTVSHKVVTLQTEKNIGVFIDIDTGLVSQKVVTQQIEKKM